MKRVLLLLPLVAFGATSTPALADCRKSGTFNISSAGPWPMSMTVPSGTSCDGSFTLNFPGTHLYIVSNPAHGRLSLREGGHYNYASASGYRGSDSFTLKVCGRIQGAQTESCTDLKYAVTVE